MEKELKDDSKEVLYRCMKCKESVYAPVADSDGLCDRCRYLLKVLNDTIASEFIVLV